MQKKYCWGFFCFLRAAFGYGRLGHPQSLEYSSPFFAFEPLQGNSCVRNNFCPNILAQLEDICKKKKFWVNLIFYEKN